MLTPFIVLVSLTSLGRMSAQEPAIMSLPPTHPRSGQPAAAETTTAIAPASLYRTRREAAAAATQAAYRAATVERNRGRALRLFLVALRRDPLNPLALFDIAVLCEQEDRWGEALSFLQEARKLAAPGSEMARSLTEETARAEAIERLQRSAAGKTRRQFDLALMAALPRSTDPFAGLAAAAQLVKIDKTRWEAPALAGMLHAQTGQFADSVRDLEEAARLADSTHAPRLTSAAEVASREAGYLEQAHTADPLWEAHQWERAAKTYEQAWEKSPRHADAAMLAVTGYLMIDQVDAAVRLLAKLRDAAPATRAKAAAMLKELAAVSEEAGKEAARSAPASETAEPDPQARIRDLVGPLTTAEMELACKPYPPLMADQTPVIPLPDKDLDAGAPFLSTESVYQLFLTNLAPPPPAAAKEPVPEPNAAPGSPRARNSPDANSTGGHGDVVSIQSEPSGAEVVVDDAIKCTAPCLIALPPGRHALRSQLAGYRQALRIFEVPKNSPPPTVRVVLEAKRGWLEVDSDPQGAPVFLDGRPTDQRTPARFQLAEGEHEVGVDVDGKIRPEKISITDNAMIKVRY